MARSARSVACLLVTGAALFAACSTQTSFSTDNALAHVRMLAGTIGSRPSGSDANRRARQYIIGQLRRSGFDVRVQEADGARPSYGATAHVRNIVATRPGRRPFAIALVAHYDSVPDGPGAADDALGVGVCLEAGRILARRATPNYALALVFTDGEEYGLMGAAALLRDPIAGWMRAVVNFEAIGSSGPALLFETTPRSGSVLQAWASQVRWPAGASFMTEIYRHLRADTDLTLLKRTGLAGANFAPVGDSYTYHTQLDNVSRLDRASVRHAGDNAVALAEALDVTDLSAPRDSPSTYFDVAHAFAVLYGPGTALVLLAVSLLLGLFGWIQAFSVARHMTTIRQVALTALWAVASVAAAGMAMLGSAWLLRATREAYHPWYAHPDRFFVFLALAGIFGTWLVARARWWVPAAWRGAAHPSVLWLLTLPAWMAIAIAGQLLAPSAAWLAVLPLAAAGAALAILSVRSMGAARIGAAITVGFGAVLWLPNAALLAHFMVPVLGRVPIVTPLAVYPALLLFCGLFVVPPLVILAAGREWHFDWHRGRYLLRPGLQPGAMLTAAVVFSCAWCWFAPAYTHERPLQRTIRYVNNVAEGEAHWEVGSTEPGFDVDPRAPVAGDWQPTTAPFRFGTPLDLLQWPFAYRARSAAVERPPVQVSSELKCDPEGCTAEIAAVPAIDDLVVVFSMPAGVVPEETNLPGIVENGEYRAIYASVPHAGFTFRARVPSEQATAMDAARVIVVASGLPGATWPALPPWLPREHVLWHARSYFVLPARPVVTRR
jgi:hypothetical protein